MRVQEVILEGSIKYMLVDERGIPIVPVVKYLKYLDSTGKSRNTQKTYCYALKQYFIYLRETEKDYKEIKLEHLADFVGWLRHPYTSLNATSFLPVKPKKLKKQ